MSRLVRWTLVPILLGALLAGTALAQGLFPKGVFGTIKDEDGNPVAELTVVMKPNIATAGPQKLKTNKKGSFIFPQLEFLQDGYVFTIESSEWFIRSFAIMTRTGEGVIFQDDSGKLGPTQQAALPIVRHRGFNTKIDLVLAKIATYAGSAAPTGGAAPGAPKRAAGQAATPEQEADEAEALGDFTTAAAKIGKALETKTNDPDLLWRRAQLLQKAGETSEALKVASKLTAVAPGKKGVRLGMAGWMVDSGNAEGSVELLAKEAELDPDNPAVARATVMALQATGAADDRLEKAAERWVALAPEAAEALVTLAGVRNKKGDFAGAEQLYQKVADQDPSAADKMLFNVGATIMNRGGASDEDRRRAIGAFKKAVEINPKYAKAWLEMGFAAVTVDKELAKKAFEEFLKLTPNDPSAKDVKEILKGM